MKLFVTSILGLALIASPALAQQDNTVSSDQQATTAHSTHVRTTTRHIHATNVPVRHHTTTHRRVRHHTMRCGCPPTHMRGHHTTTHHTVKTTTTTTKPQG